MFIHLFLSAFHVYKETVCIFHDVCFLTRIFYTYSRRQPPFNPYFWQNRNLSNEIQEIQLAELSNMQNPFNFNSLRRHPRGCYTPNCVLSQNYGVFPDSVMLQNYGVVPYAGNQYDFFTRQFQNELELKHHFNSLLNICPSDVYGSGSTKGYNDLSRYNNKDKVANRKIENSENSFFTEEQQNLSEDDVQRGYGLRCGNSVQWYSSGAREDHDQWSSTNNTQQQHKTGGSWVTFNNV